MTGRIICKQYASAAYKYYHKHFCISVLLCARQTVFIFNHAK